MENEEFIKRVKAVAGLQTHAQEDAERTKEEEQKETSNAEKQRRSPIIEYMQVNLAPIVSGTIAAFASAFVDHPTLEVHVQEQQSEFNGPVFSKAVILVAKIANMVAKPQRPQRIGKLLIAVGEDKILRLTVQAPRFANCPLPTQSVEAISVESVVPDAVRKVIMRALENYAAYAATCLR